MVGDLSGPDVFSVVLGLVSGAYCIAQHRYLARSARRGAEMVSRRTLPVSWERYYSIGFIFVGLCFVSFALLIALGAILPAARAPRN